MSNYAEINLAFEKGRQSAMAGNNRDSCYGNGELSDAWYRGYDSVTNYAKLQFALNAPEPPKEVLHSYLNDLLNENKDMHPNERNARAYARWAWQYADAVIIERK